MCKHKLIYKLSQYFIITILKQVIAIPIIENLLKPLFKGFGDIIFLLIPFSQTTILFLPLPPQQTKNNTNMKKLLILIFIGLGLCSLAQTAKPQWVNYNSKYSVNCIVPDGNTMWVGTNGGGAYQCDLQGTILLDYTTDNGFLSNNVQCIYLDSKGAKWFGTDNGLLKFENKIWTTYTKTNGLAGNLIYSIKEDSNGSIWFGTLGGISKYNGNNWI